jgi:hypothetical protein
LTETSEVKPVEQTTEKPKRKGQFGGPQANPRGRAGIYETRRATLLDACERGNLRDAEFLWGISELTKHDYLHKRPLDLKKTLNLLRKAVKADARGKRYVNGSHLKAALELIDRIEEQIKAAKVAAEKPAVAAPVLVQPDANEDPAEVTKQREASAIPVVRTPKVSEKVEKPRVHDARPIPPSEFERIKLPVVHDGYMPPLPGENAILGFAPVASMMAAFLKSRKIEFEETGHAPMGAVEGNVVVQSSVLAPRVFPKVKRAHYVTWSEGGYKDADVPFDMREDYKAMLRSLDSVVLAAPSDSAPTIEPFEYISEFRDNRPHVNYPGRKARKWGTAIDDAKKQGPRDPGIGGGCELAEAYARAAREPGFDL